MKQTNNFKNDITNEIKELIKYYDLGFVLNNIDDLVTLPIPFKNQKISNEQFSNNINIADETNEKSKEVYTELISEVALRKSTFNSIRRSFPNFCQTMKNKLSPTDYEEYLQLLRICSRDITNLIASFKDRDNDYGKLLLNKKDAISSIIDTEENSRLTFLQDTFVLEELDTINPAEVDLNTQENIAKIRTRLEDRINGYKNFQRLYSSNNIIKIKSANKNEER